MASNRTQDHDFIREWAEKRGAKPAEVASTEQPDQPGILRLEFPGAPNANDEALKEISWEDCFGKFDSSGLELLYEEETAGGETSNFNKLIYPEADSEAGKRLLKKSAGKKSSGKKAASTKGAKKTVSLKASGKSAGKKAAGKKTASKKTSAKTATAKKGAAKKGAVKKAAAKKTAVKKTPAKKGPAKKTATKKTASKKTAVKKIAGKKAVVKGTR